MSSGLSLQNKAHDLKNKFNRERKVNNLNNAKESLAIRKENTLALAEKGIPFPSEIQIEAFQAQLNSESIKSLATDFKN